MGFINYTGPHLLSKEHFGVLTCLRMVGGPKIASQSVKIAGLLPDFKRSYMGFIDHSGLSTAA